MKKTIILILFLIVSKVSFAQWTAIDSGVFAAVWLVQPNDGWSFASTFRHWDGTNWTTVIQDSAFMAQTCAFTSPNDGWVFGLQDSLYWYNGSVWTKKYSGRHWILYCDFFDTDNGWLLSPDTTYQYQNGIWSMHTISLPAYIPNLYYTSISASDQNTAWITGITTFYQPARDTSYIFKFSSGQWIIDTALPNVYLYAICFSDQNHGWAGGLDITTYQSIIFKYDGNGWHTEYISPGHNTYGVNAIYMFNNHLGWASDGYYEINGYNGSTWSFLDSIPGKLVAQFSFSDPSNGWVLGRNAGHFWPSGYIYSTTTGGLGVETLKSSNPSEISIFPNPATDYISVECVHKQNLTLSIFNIVGELVLKNELLSSTSEIDIRSLPAGMYIIKASAATWTAQKKIIKE
ncbi:MAG: T9SS type A sorting domain-containing protein [Bacteroidota bacterium]